MNTVSPMQTTQPTRRPSRPTLVASVPAGHVYVHHLAPETGTGPVRLPDPDPHDSGRAATGQWWPPVMLDPAWVRAHDFDVMHLHFGFDGRAPDDLDAWVRALRETGRPLVYTVHDLRNPHHPSRELHDRQLDVLVPAADRLVTLTPGAAAEIRRRWDREAVVLPHPHVVPFATMRAARAMRAVRSRGPERTPFVIGMHVKSLRPSMDPGRLLPVLLETVRDLPGAVLQVNAHRDVLEPDGLRYDAELATTLRRHAAAERIDLRVHDCFTDDELWCYLASLDVSVLPYRFGTHSGWLEACRDLGTTVVAPSCGYFAEQGPVLSYGHDETFFDAPTLEDALHRAYHDRTDRSASVEERRAQRRGLALAHDRIYSALLEG